MRLLPLVELLSYQRCPVCEGEIRAGGEGSGCNPDVGKCGRPKGSLGKAKAATWHRKKDLKGKQNAFTGVVAGHNVVMRRVGDPGEKDKHWSVEIDGELKNKKFPNANAAKKAVEKEFGVARKKDRIIPPRKEKAEEKKLSGREKIANAVKNGKFIEIHDSELDDMSFAVSEVRSVRPIKHGGISGSYKMVFKDGRAAAWKPNDEEYGGPNNDLSSLGEVLKDGIKPGTSARREVAASDVGRIMGMNTVPPTYLRRHKNKVGSAQEWRSGGPTGRHGLFEVPRKDVESAAIFDYVTGNTDRHGKNFLTDGDRLHLIDHGYTFGNKTRGHREIVRFAAIEGWSIPTSVAQDYKKKWPQIESALTARRIPRNQITLTGKRIDRLQEMEDFTQIEATMKQGAWG